MVLSHGPGKLRVHGEVLLHAYCSRGDDHAVDVSYSEPRDTLRPGECAVDLLGGVDDWFPVFEPWIGPELVDDEKIAGELDHAVAVFGNELNPGGEPPHSGCHL